MHCLYPHKGYRQAAWMLVAHLLLTRRLMLMQRHFEMLLGCYPQCCPQNAGITMKPVILVRY